MNRRMLVLVCSLLGLIVVSHLWVQKQRDFDRGCWGFGSSGDVSGMVGCKDPILEAQSEYFGVPVSALGFIFYATTALCALAEIMLSARVKRLVQIFLECVVYLGFSFSLRLVYIQAFVAKAYCALCVVSSLIVAVLAITLLYQRLTRAKSDDSESAVRDPSEMGRAFFAVSGALMVAAFLLLYLDRLGLRKLNDPEELVEFESALRRVLPTVLDGVEVKDRKGEFDLTAPRLEAGEWLGDLEPLAGKLGFPVVAFIDPNCRHCQETFGALERLALRYEASFYVVCRPLWNYSLYQATALEWTKGTESYYKLWRHFYSNFQEKGWSQNQVIAALGAMDRSPAEFEKDFPAVARRVQDNVGKFLLAGINITPAVYIDGLKMKAGTISETGIEELIKKRLALKEK
jgi:uncharacterized membrane protein